MGMAIRPCALREDITVVMMSGRLDMAESAAIVSELLDAVKQCASGVILDMADVTFVSSAGLRILLKARKEASASEKTLAIVRAQPSVYKIFKVSRLETLLTCFENEADAVAAIDGGKV